MNEPASGFSTLSSKLLPWLKPALAQLEAARAAKRLGHAWLLAGPAGIGKLNLALVLAGRLLARGMPGDAPADLPAADVVAAMRDRHAPVDHHPDLHWLFPEEEKRTISVEQIRDAAESLNLRSHAGGAKVVVIEPADGMTSSAANALLKTLEEPSGDTYLMLLSHQPQRLPATIRSRCQRLNLARPSAEDLAAWIGVTPAELAQASLLTGGSPLQTAALLADTPLQNNMLDNQLALVSRDEVEAQSVAAEWMKSDPELALTWLTRELHRQIRLRLAPALSTSVTDRDRGMLHNAWSKLTLGCLFEQYDTAERLLNQLGSGINMELALQAMLLGFQGNRGRP
jgi:DNA polymerase III subunit delta'